MRPARITAIRECQQVSPRRVLASHSLLVEEALDDHDMLKHYENGADLVQDWPAKRVKPPAETASFLKSIVSNSIVRERCRLRRLRRVEPQR